MRKLILGVAALLVLSATQIHAQAMYPSSSSSGVRPASVGVPSSAPVAAAPGCNDGCGPAYLPNAGLGYGYQGDPRFGINPGLRGLFGSIHSKGPSSPGASIFGGRNRVAQGVVNLPYATGGTLVFPQNPYVRSPRDFFMWEPR